MLEIRDHAIHFGKELGSGEDRAKIRSQVDEISDFSLEIIQNDLKKNEVKYKNLR